MKRTILLLAGALQAVLLFAQTTQPVPAEPSAHPNPQAVNLLEVFQHGYFHGSFRTFLMATDNTRQLSDYYAWAAGGSLHFVSAPWHGVSFGLGGMFNYNLASSDLAAKDALTGAVNRYEIGLFDVKNPKNRKNLDRTEELWLRYQWKISPRSTVEWYSFGESIGLYPKGLNPDGTGSGYPQNVESKGIGILGITRQWGKRTKVQVWDQYVQNIFNTTYAQADHIHPLPDGHKWLFGLQITHQGALAHGGNEEASKTYFQKGGQSNAISAQTGWQRGSWQALAAYTRVTADGRFLSPREWGREPFYTFMSRERVEGSGDSHSITGRVIWQNESEKLRLEAAYGRFYMPDVKNAALNKYAFPSFEQLNLDVRYAFGGMFEGLRVQFLYVWKGRLGDVYGNDKYVINRVDMSHYNLIFNFIY